MKTLIFATGNNHKISEAQEIIGTNRYHLKSLKDIGVTEDIPETGKTLEENALIKARHVHLTTRNPVFSEDTGLEVDVLNGAPGVFTARYAGSKKNAHDNMELLLKNMQGFHNRSAQFRAVIALIINQEEHLFEGIIRGRIATEISGKNGFGYDPIFIPEGYNKSFAELPSDVKQSLSHRSRALQKMFAHIENS